jgi:hypothetical protein
MTGIEREFLTSSPEPKASRNRMSADTSARPRASLSQRVNSGMCRQTRISAALIASSVPLHRPTVSPPTLVHDGIRVDAHLLEIGSSAAANAGHSLAAGLGPSRAR